MHIVMQLFLFYLKRILKISTYVISNYRRSVDMWVGEVYIITQNIQVSSSYVCLRQTLFYSWI